MSKNNKPVCEFIGYHLKKCSYQRNISSHGIKKVNISVNNIESLENERVRFDSEVIIELLDGAVCTFVYSSLFQINNNDWFNEQNKEGNFSITQLFSLVFPYIRSSIAAITNDSIGSIQLPVMNVIGLDITQGVEFNTNKHAK